MLPLPRLYGTGIGSHFKLRKIKILFKKFYKNHGNYCRKSHENYR